MLFKYPGNYASQVISKFIYLGTVAMFGVNMLLGMGMVASLIEKGSEEYLQESRLRVHQRLNKEDARIIGATRVFAVKVLGTLPFLTLCIILVIFSFLPKSSISIISYQKF